ncbi:lupus La protein [Nematocida sp. AWRm77]|nr:lupus La protein [Nematocida sp. AWRm77]
MTHPKTQEIAKQVCYYFSDANIVRDAHLQSLMKANEGYVPISVLNQFNRMKKFDVSDDALLAILQTVPTLEVKEQKVKRAEPIPTADTHNALSKTIIVRNFPTTMGLEEIEALLSPYEDRIARIAMRKDNAKNFTGSIYLETKTPEDIAYLQTLSIKVPVVSAEETQDSNDQNPAKKAKVESETVLDFTTPTECLVQKRMQRQYIKEEKEKEAKEQLQRLFRNKVFSFSSSLAQAKSSPEEAEANENVLAENTAASEKALSEKEPSEGASTEKAPTEEEPKPLTIADIKAAVSDAAFVDLANSYIRLKEPREVPEPLTIGAHTITFARLTEEQLDLYCKDLTLSKKGKVSRARK